MASARRRDLDRKGADCPLFAHFVSKAHLYRSRPETTLTRSASEVDKFFPRLRVGLVYDVSNLTGSGITRIIHKRWERDINLLV